MSHVLVWKSERYRAAQQVEMKTQDQIVKELLDKVPEEHRKMAALAIETNIDKDVPLMTKGDRCFSYYTEWITDPDGHKSLKLTVTVGLPFMVSSREYVPINDDNARHVDKVFSKSDWSSVKDDIQVLEGGDRLLLGERANAHLLESVS